MSFVLVVEGIIGSGKSTLVKQLSEEFDWRPMFEPVKENPYLEKFYADPKRWSLEMQFYLMSTRFQMHQDGIEHVWKTGQPVVFDRGIYGDSVFCEKLYQDGMIDEIGYRSYHNMKAAMLRFLLVPQVTLYLDTNPSVCVDRIKMRGRDCEKGIPLEYLTGLDRCYRKLLMEMEDMGSNVIRIDWNEFKPLSHVKESIFTALPDRFKAYQEAQPEAQIDWSRFNGVK